MRNVLKVAVMAIALGVSLAAFAGELTLSAVSVNSNTPGDEGAWYTDGPNVGIILDHTGDPTHYLVKEAYYPNEDPPVLDGTETWSTFEGYLLSHAIQGGEGKVTLYVWIKDAASTIGPVGDWIVYSNAEPAIYDVVLERAWGHSLTVSFYAKIGDDDLPAIGWVEARETGSADPWIVGGPSDYADLQNVVSVTGLEPNTSYDVMVHADASVDGPYTYSTGNLLQIINPSAAADASTIRVRWQTDRAARGWLTYGLPGQPLTTVSSSDELLTEHEVTITGLTALTTYDVNVHSEDVVHAMSACTLASPSKYYWDGSDAEYDAGYLADQPYGNNWLTAYPENSGVAVTALPGAQGTNAYINAGRAQFSSSNGYPRGSVTGMFRTRAWVSGTGELIWNDGTYHDAGYGWVIEANGLITINGGIMDAGAAWGNHWIRQGGTCTIIGGELRKGVKMQPLSGEIDPSEIVLNISGGTVTDDRANFGVNLQQGTINQTGGSVTATAINVGIHNTGLNITALYNLGDAEGNTGTITGSGRLIVGGNYNYPGYPHARTMVADLRGYGNIDIATVENNRRVIADGRGAERTLDMSGVTTITAREVEHTTGGYRDLGPGRFGWFAENKGKLTLPTLDVADGTSVAYWGENPATQLEGRDLINSIRMNFANVQGGQVSASLLALDRSEVGNIFPDKTLAVWDIDATALAFGSGNVVLTIRYDDYLAQDLQLQQADLKVFARGTGAWMDVTDGVLTTPTTITTLPLTSLQQIAVATEVVASGASITEFSVTGTPEGSPEYTTQSTVNIVLTAEPSPDATITGWMVTESTGQPALDDPDWEDESPTTYDIPGGCRTVVLYAWVKDSTGSIDGSIASIFYDTDIPNETVVSEFIVAGGASKTDQQTVSVSLVGSPKFGETINGWMITTTPDVPSFGSPEWSTTEITSYQFGNTGFYTLYGWVRDTEDSVAGSELVEIIYWPAANISDAAIAAAATSARLRWTTDVEILPLVRYGIAGQPLESWYTGGESPTPATNHDRTITGLTTNQVYTFEIHTGSTSHSLDAYIGGHFYWDGSDAEFDAGYLADTPFGNSWLSNWPEQTGVPASILPGVSNNAYVNAGRVQFSSSAYAGSNGYFRSRAWVSGTGELVWNSATYNDAGYGWVIEANGLITINGGIMDAGATWGNHWIRQGGTCTITGGELRKGVQMRPVTTVEIDPNEIVFNIRGGAVTDDRSDITKGVNQQQGIINHTGGSVNAVTVTIGALWSQHSVTAYYNLGDAEGNTGTITGSGRLIVGANHNYPGYPHNRSMVADLRGYSVIDIATVENNRRVIADGYGAERTLDMSGVTTITAREDETSTGGYCDLGPGRFGWFAENKGKLVLPAIDVAAGSSNVYWGENPETFIEVEEGNRELINSIKISFTGVDGGSISASLLALDRSEIEMIDPAKTLAVWDIDATALALGAGNAVLTIRYDNYLADDLALNQADLKVFKKEPAGWVDVTDTVDTVGGKIATEPLTSFSQIAVATEIGVAPPEYSTYAFSVDADTPAYVGEDMNAEVTLASVEVKDNGYALVGVSVEADGPGIVTVTKVDTGLWPAEGFELPNDYSQAVNYTLNFSKCGEYTVTLSCYEIGDEENPIVEDSITVNVSVYGDVNLDNKVDLLDLVFVRNRLFSEEPEHLAADITSDGFVDLEDLIEVRNNLGAACE